MTLKMLRSYQFNGNNHVTYIGNVGDELPLHDHTFNHTTAVMHGRIECFTDDGLIISCEFPHDIEAVEYTPGRRHGIRCMTNGAVFENVSPIINGSIAH